MNLLTLNVIFDVPIVLVGNLSLVVDLDLLKLLDLLHLVIVIIVMIEIIDLVMMFYLECLVPSSVIWLPDYPPM